MGSRVRWADLLPELISRIVDRLENGNDIRQFRAVCRSWRSSCRYPPNLISLHLPPKISSVNGPLKSESNPPELAIHSCSIYLLVPCQDQTSTTLPVPWLLRLQELSPGKFKLRSPLLSHILPKADNIDPSGFQVIELAKSYHFTRRRISYEAIYKVLLLSNPKSDDIATLVLTASGKVFAVRSGKEGWEPIIFEQASRIDDIVHFKGVVYAVDNRGCLYRINKTLLIDLVSVPLRGHHYPETRKRLVELNREIYLVREINFKVQVYKLNERRCIWCTTDDFGDKILFVGIDCCFFASAELFPRWKGSGICFHFGSFQTNIGCRFPDLSWEDPRSQYLTSNAVYYMRLGDETHKELSTDEDVLMCPPVPQSRS